MKESDHKNIFFRIGFKSVVAEDYSVQTEVYPPEDIHTKNITLLSNGILTLHSGFPWDNSTFAIDTRRSRRGSAIHDALLRLCNRPLCLLSWDFKPAIDREYYKALLTDGFPRRWAKIRYKAVQKGSGHSKETAHILCSAPDKRAVNFDTRGMA